MLPALLPLCALLAVGLQATSAERCSCELTNLAEPFPHEKLVGVEDDASQCNRDITQQKTRELEILLLGLDRRLPQLEADVDSLVREDDGSLYAVLSLQLIENELKDIWNLIDKLNGTSEAHMELAADTAAQLADIQEEMKELERFDTMQVVRRQEANQRLKRDLDQCKGELHPVVPPTEAPHSECPHGRFVNVSKPRVYTAGEYPGSYKYGSWGRDALPEEGKEDWHWVVLLTSSNRYGHYVRQYATLSALIVGVSTPGNAMIHSSNPTTNTIQGPNAVLHGGALYYNCYNDDAVCRFNLTTKTVSTVDLPPGTKYNSKANFCHLDECYPFTDMDLATDESGVWVIYTTSQDLGNLVLSKVEPGEPPSLGQTWSTSLYKPGVTNTFMVCGVLYATRYVDKEHEEIFYSFDTVSRQEKFNLGIVFKKMQPSILSLNYSPVDQMLHAYCDSHMVSYKVLFE